ncbi:MAG: choice-of-anchor A family protein, partial [Ruminococcus sp.]|nr:choice-of-anchor A family protein [Ruminococcus sp.]
MKELQNIIHRHFEDPKQKKRYLAVLIALSMLVSFMVPLILMEPADSITKNKFRASSAAGIDIPNLNNGQDANNGYSRGHLSEVTLLIGYGVDWAADCQSAEQVIEAAKMKYFLGIASDFCVFLEGDFEPKDADAEGRVAVGGDVVFEHNQYNYQLGAGDFGDSIALIDTDNYKGVTNFAHLIMGGDILTNIATFGTKDRGASLADENKDRYKRFVVYNGFELSSNTHFGDGGAMSYGGDHGHYGAGFSESSQFYKRDNLIDFENVFLWLKEQSIKLGRKSAKGSTKISYEPHERVGSANGTTNFEGGNLLTVTFTGPGRDSGLDTIYFDLDEWNVDKLTDGTPINEGDYIQSVRFEDVPENANLVVNCGGEIIRIGAAGDKDFFSTYINGEIISNTGDYNSNNNKKSEQILYNFYECGLKPEVIDTTIQTIKNEDGTIKETREVPYQLFLDCNFNGSVLAPNAIVVSDYHCGGHLSGALIAQSFNGGLEFGYRPYRGSTDILGSTAGYAIPFNKFKQDGSTYLPGAMFAITEAGADGKMIESWKTGTTTSYITIPSKVDFEGDTTYTGQNNTISGEYIVQEQSAPEGYVLSDKTYRLYVNETVDVGTLIKTDNGTIPTRILVNLEIKDDNGELIDSYEMTIRDTYSEDGLIQRIISIKNENGKQYFVLDINPEDGKIKSIGEPKDTSVLDSAEAEGALNNIVLYANQIVDYLSSEGTEGGETEGQDETTTTTVATTSADETTTTTVTSSLFPPGYQEPTLTVTY